MAADNDGLGGVKAIDLGMTPKQLAGHLKISRATIQRHITKGIPHERLGARIYFKLDDVMTWLRAQGVAQRKRRTR